MNEDMSRIRHVSRIMMAVCTAVILFVPLALALVWINFESAAPNFEFLRRIPYQPANLTGLNLLAGFAVSLSLAGVLLFGVHRLRRLFALYSSGQVFTPENAACIRGFALSALAYAALTPVTEVLLSVILTVGNPPGQRALVISVSSTEFVLLFLGAVLLIVSWVMKESAKLAEEHAQII